MQQLIVQRYLTTISINTVTQPLEFVFRARNHKIFTMNSRQKLILPTQIKQLVLPLPPFPAY